MDDRYLFKAKRIDTGEWVKGFYVKDRIGNDGSPSDVIFVPWIENRNEEWGFIKVDPSTICQCTGLRDKNGKLIWENDICIIKDGTLDEEDGYFRLDWEIDRAMFEFEGTGLCVNFDNVNGYECEVVGNIFDNPELLEV